MRRSFSFSFLVLFAIWLTVFESVNAEPGGNDVKLYTYNSHDCKEDHLIDTAVITSTPFCYDYSWGDNHMSLRLSCIAGFVSLTRHSEPNCTDSSQYWPNQYKQGQCFKIQSSGPTDRTYARVDCGDGIELQPTVANSVHYSPANQNTTPLAILTIAFITCIVAHLSRSH